MYDSRNLSSVTAISIRQYLYQRHILIPAFICFSMLYFGSVDVERASAANENSKNGIASLSWIQGNWFNKGTALGGQGLGKLDPNVTLEERWSEPIGDSMVGVFRWIKDDKIWMFEFLTIVEHGEDIFLRWKHFDRDLVGWERKEASLAFRLISLQDRKAVFEQVEYAKVHGPSRVTYHRTNDLTLTVRLDYKENSLSPSVFMFRLQD